MTSRSSRAAGATTAKTGTSAKLGAWLSHHRRVARESLQSVLSSWATSLMTWMVIGIALALPVVLYLMLVNVGHVTEGWDGSPAISLYLARNTREESARALVSELSREPDVESVTFISPADALAEFQAVSGFRDVLSTLDENPLPAVIEVRSALRETSDLRMQSARLGRNPLVEAVRVDLEWIERLFAILRFGQRLVAALGLILAMGVLLVIGNTIRLAIENRRNEIEVVKLVGGTDRFVRRPFLYLGFWYGLGGSVFAWILVESSLLILSAPVEILAQSYRDDFALSGLGPGESLAILGLGSGLGILGARLAVGRHLSEFAPDQV